MRKKLSWDQIAKDPNYYGLSRTSIWRAKNRGWGWVGYHTSEKFVVRPVFLRYCSDEALELTKSAAVAVLRKAKAPGRFWRDAIQESLLRYVELSGVHEDGRVRDLYSWCYAVAKPAVLNFLTREGYWRSRHRRHRGLHQLETRPAA
jgi:hypothetical protein